MNDSIITLFTALIAILGSGAAWKFYEKRLKLKHDDTQAEKTLFRNELRSRINTLEKDLDDEQIKREQDRAELTKLSSDIAALRVKVDFLGRENADLKARLMAG